MVLYSDLLLIDDYLTYRRDWLLPWDAISRFLLRKGN